MSNRFPTALVFFLALPCLVFADDHIGQLSVSDLHLAPYAQYVEGKTGGFFLRNYLLGVSWQTESSISAKLKLGAPELVYQPLKYTIASTSSRAAIGLIEAYGEYDSPIGQLRMGRVPVGFGLEALKTEAELIFQRSFWFERGIGNFRDDGISYSISNKNIYSVWAVHNGEASSNLDNETWMTAQFGGYIGSILIAISGQTGRTLPSSTNPNAAVLTGAQQARVGFDINQNARHRLSMLSTEWSDQKSGVLLEGGFQEIEQDLAGSLIRYKSLFWHLDGWFKSTPALWVLARFQSLDVRQDSPGDRIEEATLGLSLRTNSYGNGRFELLAIRRFDETLSKPQHEVRLVFQLNPSL